MSSRKLENIFASPWKESDLVLVVDEAEFHVHRYMLAIQSPVFKKLLNGEFKEATQDKITLEGKNSDDMLQFLKLLYPPAMIETELISLDEGDNLLKMLALADEYQILDLIKSCLKIESYITSDNVLKILPYADRYELRSVREKCIDVILRHVSVSKLDLSQQNEQTQEDIKLAKLEFLESNLVGAYNTIQHTMFMSSQGKSKSCCYSAGRSTRYIKHARECQSCSGVFTNYVNELRGQKMYGELSPLQLMTNLEDVKTSTDIPVYSGFKFN